MIDATVLPDVQHHGGAGISSTYLASMWYTFAGKIISNGTWQRALKFDHCNAWKVGDVVGLRVDRSGEKDVLRFYVSGEALVPDVVLAAEWLDKEIAFAVSLQKMDACVTLVDVDM